MLVVLTTLCDEILAVDENIRFVAHLDSKFNLLERKQRAGVKSITNETNEERFFGLVQPIIMGASSRIEIDFGKLKTVRLKYAKVSIVFLSIPDAIIGFSMEPGPTTPIIEKLGKKFKVDLK